MKKNELAALMKQRGIAPLRQLGQNFLTDNQFLDYMVRLAAPGKDDRILEIGPGFGALTERLLAAGVKHLCAIEIDRKLAEYLHENLVPHGLDLREGDACRMKLDDIFGPGVDFRVISNLPYSAGTVAVVRLLDLTTPPADMILMLQKEVALRFIADPGTDAYGSLSVRLAAVYSASILRTVPPDLFYPRPEVDSCVVHLVRKDPIPSASLRKILSTLVRSAFAHRRKKMFKQTAAVFGEEALRAAMKKTGVPPDIRAEKVSPEDFLAMARLLAPADAD